MAYFVHYNFNMFYPIYFYRSCTLSVLYLNIKTYTLALVIGVQSNYLKTFCYKGGKIKNTYILLDGLVCRVSMDIFMSPL